MHLYTYVSIKSFIEGCKASDSDPVLTLQIPNMMYSAQEYETEYGLSLLRQAIGLYEKKNNIAPDQSKQAMPFFRKNRKMLVGPEMEMYALSLFESQTVPHSLKLGHSYPYVRLMLDYQLLGEYCLSQNMYLLRCKYDKEKNLQTFADQMEQEYNKFFYDDEHTGFTSDSRLFSMLCNACLEVRNPHFISEKEWRIVSFHTPSDVSYLLVDGQLIPSVTISIPFGCIRQIALQNRNENKLTYSALAGFLQQIGLMPEHYLEGMIEQ